MTLRIHGPPHSPGAQRVLIILYETGLPFQLVPVDIAGGKHKTEAWLDRHPFGQIPYMVSTFTECLDRM
jgi:glutathione S-transferase